MIYYLTFVTVKYSRPCNDLHFINSNNWRFGRVIPFSLISPRRRSVYYKGMYLNGLVNVLREILATNQRTDREEGSVSERDLKKREKEIEKEESGPLSGSCGVVVVRWLRPPYTKSFLVSKTSTQGRDCIHTCFYCQMSKDKRRDNEIFFCDGSFSMKIKKVSFFDDDFIKKFLVRKEALFYKGCEQH